MSFRGETKVETARGRRQVPPAAPSPYVGTLEASYSDEFQVIL
jgi:hypothetical protein